MAGKGNASNLIEFGSTPDFSSAARIITSPTPFNALTAIVLPARSAGDWIELEPLTMMFCQLSSAFVPSTSLVVTAVIGMPDVRAIIAGTQPAKPISPCLFASASMMSFPLWRTTFLTSSPCFSKNPCLIPMSSGRVFAIGMMLTEIGSTRVRLGRRGRRRTGEQGRRRRRQRPPRAGSRADGAYDAAPVACVLHAPFVPPSYSGGGSPTDVGDGFDRRRDLVALDQPVDVRAQVREVGQLLGRDLVSHGRQLDRHDLLDLRRRVREHDDAVREIDGFVDVVRHEEDRDPEVLAHLEDEIFEVATRLGVHGRERLVHEQDRRLVREGARDRDALLHSAGQLPRIVVDEARQADGGERLLDEPRPLGLRELLVAQRQEDVVAHASSRASSERLYSWKTTAISSGGEVTGRPSTTTPPLVGRMRPAMHFSRVVLPQPDGPTTHTNSPSPTVNVTLRSAWVAFSPVP